MLNNNHNHHPHPNSTATTTATTYATEDFPLREQPEQVPTHLNTINSSAGFLIVTTDMLSVRYTNVARHDYDVGVVQGNCPAPSRKMVYYFEMFVKNAGDKGRVCIGFTNDGFKMRRQPGWEPKSIGYHGVDGILYRPGTGDIFGPTFTTGDTIGGGINYASQEFFFTKNGMLVGTSSKDLKITLFPTIAVHSQNEEVYVNFGQQSFVFDVEAYETEERLKQQLIIEKNPLPANINHWIIRSYLQHYGYQETLNAFDNTTKSSLSPIPVALENGFDGHEEMYALSERKELRQFIRSGDIDSVSRKLQEWYPQILKDGTSTICFLLHCQKFIELVQSGLLEEFVEFAQAELAKFIGIEPLEGLLQDVIALLAYKEPLKSPVAYLLGDAQRDVTADAVNTMVLLTNPERKDSHSCVQSPLEKILKQLRACSLETRASNGDQGEVFNLQRFLESGKR